MVSFNVLSTSTETTTKRTGRVSNLDAAAFTATAIPKHAIVDSLVSSKRYSLDDRSREDGQKLKHERDKKKNREGRRGSQHGDFDPSPGQQPAPTESSEEVQLKGRSNNATESATVNSNSWNEEEARHP